MSWRGFKKGLGELVRPSYLQELSEDERQERRRRSWRRSELFFFFQAAEPKPSTKRSEPTKD